MLLQQCASRGSAGRFLFALSLLFQRILTNWDTVGSGSGKCLVQGHLIRYWQKGSLLASIALEQKAEDQVQVHGIRSIHINHSRGPKKEPTFLFTKDGPEEFPP